MADHDELRRQLADLDSQIAELRGDDAALAAQAGGQADGAQDTEDVAAQLTNVEETQGILDALEGKRQRLLDQLDAK